MPVPDFSPGEVLTAAAMDSIGLWLVKSEPIVGTPSTVTVTGAFSADFDNYKIILAGATCSGVANISGILGSTTAGYYSNRIKNSPNNGTVNGNGQDNTGDWGYFGQGGTGFVNLNVDLLSPNLAKRTTYHGSYLIEIGSSSELGTTSGFLANNTQYTAFTLTVGGGNTLSGGTIRVYGYRN
jgi:hypothetical protein